MVHALKDIWRVLTKDGKLVDLRPFHANWPMEVLVGGQVVNVGSVDNSSSISDDLAANTAIKRAVSEGWFVQERTESFDYAWYWDSSTEMKAYFENKSPPIIIPATTLTRVQEFLETGDKDTVVRVRLHMLIACYRKS